jgi:hypothetical protein
MPQNGRSETPLPLSFSQIGQRAKGTQLSEGQSSMGERVFDAHSIHRRCDDAWGQKEWIITKEKRGRKLPTPFLALDRSRLPSNWRSDPAPSALKAFGEQWVAARESAVLQVPSAIIQTESNYLLNPAHPDFRRIEVGEAERFHFDSRLVKERARLAGT